MFSNLSARNRFYICMLSASLLIGVVGVAGLKAQKTVTVEKGASGVRTTFTGTVRDSSGAVVAGATITLKNTATGMTTLDGRSSLQTVTNSSGRYGVSLLTPGTYEMDVEANGFRKNVLVGITLPIRGDIVVDSTLFKTPEK